MSSKAKSKLALPVKLLLFISFLEGGAVMIIELLGAKIIAPYYGVSLYVWSSVLGVTLGALAIGYFLGGIISRKFPNEGSLFTVILLGAFFTALAPITAPKIMMFTESMGVKMGSLISVLLYLLVPVACFGAVSPIIIQLVSRTAEHPGKTAGTVYAVSTVGGILATFLTGFYLIPTIGIKLTAFITGGVLAAIALVYFLMARRTEMLALIAIMLFVMIAIAPSTKKFSAHARVSYQSVGILGEWTVLETGDLTDPAAQNIEKRLLLNGITQTYTQSGFEPLSLWTYPHKIGCYSGLKPAGSKALLLGMGGGSIAFEILAMGMDLDIVELDSRIEHIASKYFNYDTTSAKMHIDDARHYIRRTKEKYDLVIIDLLLGEVQPSHVFSVEGFDDLKKILNEDALIVINFQGNIDDKKLSLGARSIYKTLEASGFNVSYYSNKIDEVNPSTLDTKKRTAFKMWIYKKLKKFGLRIENYKVKATNDVFFLASLEEVDYKEVMKDLRYNAWFPYDNFSYDRLIRDEPLDLSDAYVLVDDQPRLELLIAPTILQWRKNKTGVNIKVMKEEGVTLF